MLRWFFFFWLEDLFKLDILLMDLFIIWGETGEKGVSCFSVFFLVLFFVIKVSFFFFSIKLLEVGLVILLLFLECKSCIELVEWGCVRERGRDRLFSERFLMFILFEKVRCLEENLEGESFRMDLDFWRIVVFFFGWRWRNFWW